MPSIFEWKILNAGGVSLVLAAGIVIWILISMALGAVVIMMGELGNRKTFGDFARAQRAHTVGETGNTLLAELLRDANIKYEVGSGWFGLLIFGALVSTFDSLVRFGLEAGKPTNAAPDLPAWQTVLILLFIALFGLLVRQAAVASILALDKVLLEVSRETSTADRAREPG